MEKKLKIGMFVDTFLPMVDGVVMVVDNYARRLAKIADVTVFVPIGRDSYDDSTLPYKVVRCKMLKITGLDYDLPMPGLDSEFRNELKNAQLDIVHIHSPFALGKEGTIYAKKHHIPVVGSMHSQFKQDFYAVTKSKIITNSLLASIMSIYNSCTECWAVNNEVANIYLEYGAKKLPMVQNNGTDISYIDDEKGILELRKKHGIKPDEKIFLFVGRINKIKNIFFTADSLKILKDYGFKFKMLFIGIGQDEEEFKAYIESLGLSREVIFVGKITDRTLMTKYYRMADLFLFPSMYDTNSLVQIEAASQKTPTLFLRGSATSTTVTEDKNGFFSDNDPKEYADKVVSIFKDKEYYNKVSEGAFSDLFVSWDKVVNKAYNDYLRLIKKYKEDYARKPSTKLAAKRKALARVRRLHLKEKEIEKNVKSTAKKDITAKKVLVKEKYSMEKKAAKLLKNK